MFKIIPLLECKKTWIRLITAVLVPTFKFVPVLKLFECRFLYSSCSKILIIQMLCIQDEEQFNYSIYTIIMFYLIIAAIKNSVLDYIS